MAEAWEASGRADVTAASWTKSKVEESEKREREKRGERKREERREKERREKRGERKREETMGKNCWIKREGLTGCKDEIGLSRSPLRKAQP